MRRPFTGVSPALVTPFMAAGSTPGPVKWAMATMGLCEAVSRLTMVLPRREWQQKLPAILGELGLVQKGSGW